ncbi:MAG TPA: AI-2E family transporter [Chryseolinea sp.]|jgi:predicted PurR-regulated permease PerM|nr:AI-2E family transporter [Chryseolinea sp.]
MRTQNLLTNSTRGVLSVLQYIVFGSIILFFGREVFIPISFALLISFILYPVCAWLERRGMGRLLAISISISLMIVAGLLIVALLIHQFISFLNEWPSLQEKLAKSLQEISKLLINVFGISQERQQDWISKLASQSGSDLLSLVSNAVSASVSSTVLFVLVPVYSVLVLYYREQWMKIIQRIFPRVNRESLREIISLTVTAYYNFIKGMAIVYLVVGILNSIGLLLLGIPHAILFGFIAAVLTFIPYFGIMVGSLLPITVAWVTYNSIWYPIGIIAIFAVVQYLEANVIFPLAVSNRLNVNTFVMLVAIFVGGVLWGLAGMILFVPFVGIAKLIADHNPKWKTVSMILGVSEK